MDELSGCLARRWVHAHEEDVGSARTYRPEGLSLPRSRRPRSVIELGADGRFIGFAAGAGDARVARAGRWELLGPSEVTIRWDDGGEPAILEVVGCRDDLLQVRTVRGSVG